MEVAYISDLLCMYNHGNGEHKIQNWPKVLLLRQMRLDSKTQRRFGAVNKSDLLFDKSYLSGSRGNPVECIKSGFFSYSYW